MCADDLESVVDSLGGDIVVAGPDEGPETVEGLATAGRQPRVVGIGDTEEFDHDIGDAGVVVVAVDGSSAPPESAVRALDGAEFVVAVLSGRGDGGVKQSLFDTVRGWADVTLLACREQPSVPTPATRGDAGGTDVSRPEPGVAAGGAFDFVRMIREPGQINLDLADAKTVLTDGALAVFSGGTASFETGGPRKAVQRAFDVIPASVDVAVGSDALVSVTGGPEMSIADAVAAVRAVREELGAIETVIWGVAVTEDLMGRLTVEVVVDDIGYRPPLSAGDPCRRCGATLAAYTFGDRTTLACEACGFANLSTSLGGRSGQDHRR